MGGRALSVLLSRQSARAHGVVGSYLNPEPRMTAPLLEIPSRFFLGQDRAKGPPPGDLLSAQYRAEIVGFPPMDAEGHAAFARAFYAGFPDLYHTVDEVQQTSDGAIVRFTIRGTHTGAFMGIPASGRPVEIAAMALMSIENDRVSLVRGMFDQLGLMRQLGVVPS